MNTPITLTAHQFINPWGKAMPTHLVATLAVDSEKGHELWRLINAMSPTWEAQWLAAQQQTDGMISLGDTAIIECRYLITCEDYPRFKIDLKRLKSAL